VFRVKLIAGLERIGSLSDDQDNNHPLLTKRLQGACGLLAITAIGVSLMIAGILLPGAVVCVFGTLCISAVYLRDVKNIRPMILTNGGPRTLTTELWIALALIGISIISPVLVYVYLGSPSEIAALKARIDQLSQLRWMPLTNDEIVAIKHSVAGAQPAQPTMHIQYLDANAYDLAISFEKLFADIGFHPIIQLDTHMSFTGAVILDADDSGAELVRKIINSIETVTQGRIKCELRISKGQGQTRIFIGQKAQTD
jgi:hypothetical protein